MADAPSRGARSRGCFYYSRAEAQVVVSGKAVGRSRVVQVVFMAAIWPWLFLVRFSDESPLTAILLQDLQASEHSRRDGPLQPPCPKNCRGGGATRCRPIHSRFGRQGCRMPDSLGTSRLPPGHGGNIGAGDCRWPRLPMIRKGNVLTPAVIVPTSRRGQPFLDTPVCLPLSIVAVRLYGVVPPGWSAPDRRPDLLTDSPHAAAQRHGRRWLGPSAPGPDLHSPDLLRRQMPSCR